MLTADLETWAPQALPEQPGGKPLVGSNSKGKSSAGRDQGCALKAAVTETQMKTCWHRRLSVFSAGTDSTKSLLALSPFQVSQNPTTGKGKKGEARLGGSRARPGQLSSSATSAQSGARLSRYKISGSGSACNQSGTAPVTFNRKIASSGYGMTYPKQQLGKLPPKPKRSETEPGARQAAMHAANIQKAVGAQGRDNFHVWSPHAHCEAAAKVQVGFSPVTSIAVSLDGFHVLVGCGNGNLCTLPTSLSRSVRCMHCLGVVAFKLVVCFVFRAVAPLDCPRYSRLLVSEIRPHSGMSMR